MPTHEDHPWERDARRRRQDAAASRPRRRLRALSRVVVGAAVAAAVVAWLPPDSRRPAAPFADIDAAPPARTPAFAAAGGSILDLQSRRVGRAGVEIWGTTDAVDGASVQVRLEAAGVRPRRLPDAPSVGGRFYAKARIPAAMRAGGFRVRARIGG